MTDELVALAARLHLLHALHRPLALLLAARRERGTLRLVALVLLLRVTQRDRALVEIRGPPARVELTPMGVLVELEHAVDRPVEERSIVRHDDDAAVELGEERLEQIETREVEVVGRFVEEEHVEARQQDRGERRACGLPARHRGHRRVEQIDRETDAVDDRGGSRRRSRAAPRAR